MKTLLFLFLCCTAAVAFQGALAPLAFVVLDPGNLSKADIPDGWQLKVTSGSADVSTVQDNGAPVLHFKSVKSSFALERSVDVDLAKLPYLTWRWKVAQVPKGGDFRHFLTDDQAAQVLVAFDERHILSYIWDSTVAQGTRGNESSPLLVHIQAIVCQSGMSDANRWISESHNVVADYLKAFGKTATRVKGIRLQINSQHTGSSAESFFAGVAFRSSAQ